MKILSKLSFLILLLLAGNLSATTIIPFPNLGEMAKASEAVVLVHAERNYEVTEGNTTYFATGLRVVRSVSGPLARNEVFVIRNHHKRIGEYETTIWGDLEMETGKNYLLMLVMGENGYWKPMMLSYAAFEEHQRDGRSVLVPFSLGAEVQLLRSADGSIAEPLKVYDTEKLIDMLAGVVSAKKEWDHSKTATAYNISSFETAGRPAPAHCTYISGSPTARWNGFPTALPVYYHVGGDPGCPTAHAKIQGVIGTMNGSYLGINLSDGGTHTFSPTCAGQGATDGEFYTWVTSNLGQRSMTIQFDDPCNDIPDLVGCNGTLAYGGMYWSGTTHTWDGMNWRTAQVGYVVVNNDTGTCQCPSSDYDVMMTHEMTHALGIGHIASGSGLANMNPSCCNFIQPLDQQCLDYTYLNALPVELTSFTGAQDQKAIQLKWETGSEKNNDYFLLERANLSGDFEEITRIDGAGTSVTPQSYRYLDERPQSGTNYYRLTQVDLDGSTHLGDRVAVDFYNGLNISLTPNPMKTNRLTIDVGSESNGNLQIEIFDMMGKPVYSRELAIIRGRTLEELQLSDLSSGIYIMRTQKDNVVQTTRFVKPN